MARPRSTRRRTGGHRGGVADDQLGVGEDLLGRERLRRFDVADQQLDGRISQLDGRVNGIETRTAALERDLQSLRTDFNTTVERMEGRRIDRVSLTVHDTGGGEA